MKESKAFKLAQIAVLVYSNINVEQKLEILRVLMECQDMAEFREKTEEQENKNAETL